MNDDIIQSESLQSNINRIIFLFVFGVVILVNASYILFGSIGIEAVGIILTSILSALLVVLYFRQTVIQNRQSKLLRADHKPAIRRSVWEEWSEGLVRIDLENFGNGFADNLQLESVVECSNDVYETKVFRRPLYRLSDEEKTDFQPANLESGEKASFMGIVGTELEGKGTFSDLTVPFSSAVAALKVTGTRAVRWEVNIVYQNPLEEERRRKILEGTFTPKGQMSLTDSMHSIFPDGAEAMLENNASSFHFRPQPYGTSNPEECPNVNVDLTFMGFPLKDDEVKYQIPARIEIGNADAVELRMGSDVLTRVEPSDIESDDDVAKVKISELSSDPMTYGDVIQVFAFQDGNEYEVDCIPAPDRLPQVYNEAIHPEDIVKHRQTR
ncbi:uncharacterized protein Nmag_0049 [Natrialba magadii ATCC 43099]|uniref:Uncharacterized protein n=1 Tax=Natrialba magadii (strain ATCC 43099 / DSM 3394 / CCM 3739 / CIP 104546 / IAM 13178 / JCM 8861 / NBRC 102185 / NCIMB 2190 / MS3) TaxID=547559 RepID=D3SVS9_NATMM|nr:hypothetical protein [Natrialba magadii]ADD03648.1 uncharacterized protein Nmag_0049 [Natrialba magadii ATCC 43099]ELY34414.1 hypothetical protein C500_00727 [Natrialba magadii ATCC 43099]